jgi:hypothetical protein
MVVKLLERDTIGIRLLLRPARIMLIKENGLSLTTDRQL